MSAFSSQTSRPSRDELLIGIYLSFFDKKDLTNGIDCCIPCAMNTNEITQKVNARLNRIKIVSRIAKFMVLAFFAAFLWQLIFLQVVNSFPTFRALIDVSAAISAKVPIYISKAAILDDLIVRPTMAILLAVWCWKLMNLFHFYERGLIFDGKTIHCLKILGILCAVGWMLNGVSHYCSILEYQQLRPPPNLPHSPITIVHDVNFYGLRFFSFDFSLLFAGIVIVLIAWIMDEGRKIQEEQELTV
jgi:hypothetical protein